MSVRKGEIDCPGGRELFARMDVEIAMGQKSPISVRSDSHYRSGEKETPMKNSEIQVHKAKHWHSQWYYYIIPKRLTLCCNPGVYKWLWWVWSW